MEPSKEIENFIKSYESLHDGDLTQIGLQPKLCPANVWTEGWGSVLIGPDGKMLRYSEKYKTVEDVLPFSKIKTEEEADKALIANLIERMGHIRNWVNFDLNCFQMDALLSHYYNCGKSETLYRLINRGAPKEIIKSWWTTKYVTAGGTYLKGLQYRRNDEWEIWKGINYNREYKLSV